MKATELKKRINFLTGVGIAVSMVVGSGLFGLPGLIIKATSPTEAILGWLATAIAVLPLIYIFSYLGSRYPTEEGIAKYAEVLMGKSGAYAASLIACGSLAVGMPAFFLIIGHYIADFLQFSDNIYPVLFAILAIGLTTGLNLLGPEKFGAILKLTVPLVIAFSISFSIYYGIANNAASAQMLPLLLDSPISFTHLWIAASIAFWAFQGWENLSFGLGEFKDPTTSIPKIYWTSYILILLIYLPFVWMISVAAKSGIDVNGISGLSHLLGQGLIKSSLLSILIATLLINALSWTFGASRIAFSTANKQLLPKILTQISANQLPNHSLILCGFYYALVVIAVYIFNIPITKLFLLTTQGFILLYAISTLAFLKLAKNFFQKLIGLSGLVVCSLLLSGFSWLFIYPLGFAIYGFIKSAQHRVLSGATGASPLEQ